MSNSEATAGAQQPLLDVFAILRQVWSRRVLVLLIVGGFVLGAGLYLLVTKPTFTAQAVILVDPREPRTTETDNVLPGIGSDSAAIASQLAVIGSRELLTEVFEAENLASDPEYAKSLLFDLFGIGAPTRREVFESFIETVSVDRQGLTYVIDVKVKSADPEKAARIANAIVARYISGQIAQKSDANADVSDLLKGRIAGLQQDVLEAEQAVEAFKVANNIFDSGTGSTLLQAQLDQLNVQLLAAREQARQASTQYQQALAAGVSPQGLISLTEILTSPSAERLRDDYNLRSVAYASAQSALGARHPTLRQLEAEVQRVEALMVREVERITRELGAARDIAENIVVEIENEVAALQTRGNESNRMAVELRQLERNADSSRLVLEQFQRRSEETSQFENLQFSDARMITSATAPLRPTWPKPSLLLGVAGVLGLMVGVGVALLLGAPRPAEAVPQTVARRAPARRRTWAMPKLRDKVIAAAAVARPKPTPKPVEAQRPKTTPAAAASPTLAAAARPAPTPAEPEPKAPVAVAGAAQPRPTSQEPQVRAAIAELRGMKSYAELN